MDVDTRAIDSQLAMNNNALGLNGSTPQYMAASTRKVQLVNKLNSKASMANVNGTGAGGSTVIKPMESPSLKLTNSYLRTPQVQAAHLPAQSFMNPTTTQIGLGLPSSTSR